jgi:hypothetical protein
MVPVIGGLTSILIVSHTFTQYPLLIQSRYVLVTGVVAIGFIIVVELKPVVGDQVYVRGKGAPNLVAVENLHAKFVAVQPITPLKPAGANPRVPASFSIPTV